MSVYKGEMTREDVKQIVCDALRTVGDFPDCDAIEHFTFDRFHAYHKKVFLWSIKMQITAWRIDKERHYDIGLNENDIEAWPTIGACIEWLFKNKKISISNTELLSNL